MSPRTPTATSSATKPAACETTVTAEHREPPRQRAAAEVGAAPDDGGPESQEKSEARP